ncbi:MAG: DUF3298 domain-containing protein [Acidobacteria bacterium]|nr:DUF3298 domain-containing protein [Acidobacteriota bacterium]
MNTRPLATLLVFTLLFAPACASAGTGGHVSAPPAQSGSTTPASGGGANAQPPAQATGEERVFHGSVADRPATMHLRRTPDGKLSGAYSYDGRGGELTLKGSVDAKGNFTLEEFDGAKQTGAFKGWWDEKDYEPEASISGDWAKPGGGSDTTQFFYFVEQRWQAGAHVVTTKRLDEGGRKHGYSVNVEYPQVEGVEGFNRLAQAFVTKEVADFKKDAGPEKGEKETMPEASEDSLTIRYTVRLLNDSLVSVEFPIDYYEHGAAHPSHAFHVINYDVKAGRELSLADLFRPGSNYLTKVSEVAVRQVRRWNRDSAEYPGGGGQPYLDDAGIADGAKPEADNYQNWTLTPRGLAVTFDYYQLGAYAAGAPSVVLPYADLKDVLKTDGPVAPLLK